MRKLEVYLDRARVGTLVEPEQEATYFQFHESYRRLPRRPVLGQRFEDDLGRTYKGKKGKLPAFFANLVPEGKLREVMCRHFEVATDADFDLLAALGNDLPGAVILRPEGDWGSEPFEEPKTESRDEEREPGLRFSLAGVQMKLSMVIAEDRLALPGRDQMGEWIVKFDSLRFPKLPENEHAMMEWAREAGFSVPECRLYPATELETPAAEHAPPDTRVLAVRRYDRSNGNGRIHQEDFAQVVGLLPERKYDQVKYEDMLVLSDRILGREGAEEFVRRLALVIACGNNDAHLKNWSLLYGDGIQARWTPLYDQVSTVAWPELGTELALKLMSQKSFYNLKQNTFELLARKAGLPEDRAQQLLSDTWSRLREAWPRIQDRISLPPSHREALYEHWRRVPVLQQIGSLNDR